MYVTDPHLWVNRSKFFFRCEHQNRNERLSPSPWILPRITRMKTNPRTNSTTSVGSLRNAAMTVKTHKLSRAFKHVQALALRLTAASLIYRKRLMMRVKLKFFRLAAETSARGARAPQTRDLPRARVRG